MNIKNIAFEESKVSIPINLEKIEVEDIGEGVLRSTCQANGVNAKRVIKAFGVSTLETTDPVWHINGQVVQDWFGDLLESEYQKNVTNKTIILK